VTFFNVGVAGPAPAPSPAPGPSLPLGTFMPPIRGPFVGLPLPPLQAQPLPTAPPTLAGGFPLPFGPGAPGGLRSVPPTPIAFNPPLTTEQAARLAAAAALGVAPAASLGLATLGGAALTYPGLVSITPEVARQLAFWGSLGSGLFFGRPQALLPPGSIGPGPTFPPY
jgi:hypothetical protein